MTLRRELLEYPGEESTDLKETIITKKTYTYKTVGDVQVEADVYRRGDESGRPVVVWLHGGCLINGGRGGLREDLRELCGTEDYALVSLDYRLGPEVQVPEIIEDVRDAFGWIREQGPDLFGADPDRIAVTGGSAGGYLTMMTGICIEPRPTVLVSYFGYGDVDGLWYCEPSPYYCEHCDIISKEEAYGAVGGEVLTNTSWDSEVAQKRSRYYRYLRQNGLWTKEMTGFDPETEREKLDPYCPVRNITPEYPPIIMLHGTEDNDVPCEQSAGMAAELERHGVRHEFIPIAGAGHGLSDGDPQVTADARARALEFIKEHLA